VTKKASILIVDDEPDICWALKLCLGDEGYQVTQVSRGEEAVEAVEKGGVDVAIIDVKLPGKNGIEISRMLKQLDPKLKILMISGYHYEDDQPIQEGLQRGNCLGFISKPFELDQVSALVRRVIHEEIFPGSS